MNGLTSATDWPPFAASPLSDGRLWQYVGAGDLVDAAPLITRHRGHVFWIPWPGICSLTARPRTWAASQADAAPLASGQAGRRDVGLLPQEGAAGESRRSVRHDLACDFQGAATGRVLSGFGPAIAAGAVSWCSWEIRRGGSSPSEPVLCSSARWPPWWP